MSKQFTENFRSPFTAKTYREAVDILNNIREEHSFEKGWFENESHIDEETDENGEKVYRPYRTHTKFNS